MSNNDILDAMDKLSRMMDSDKKTIEGTPDSYDRCNKILDSKAKH